MVHKMEVVELVVAVNSNGYEMLVALLSKLCKICSFEIQED